MTKDCLKERSCGFKINLIVPKLQKKCSIFGAKKLMLLCQFFMGASASIFLSENFLTQHKGRGGQPQPELSRFLFMARRNHKNHDGIVSIVAITIIITATAAIMPGTDSDCPQDSKSRGDMPTRTPNKFTMRRMGGGEPEPDQRQGGTPACDTASEFEFLNLDSDNDDPTLLLSEALPGQWLAPGQSKARTEARSRVSSSRFHWAQGHFVRQQYRVPPSPAAARDRAAGGCQGAGLPPGQHSRGRGRDSASKHGVKTLPLSESV
jgi:hypothetical protein